MEAAIGLGRSGFRAALVEMLIMDSTILEALNQSHLEDLSTNKCKLVVDPSDSPSTATISMSTTKMITLKLLGYTSSIQLESGTIIMSVS